MQGRNLKLAKHMDKAKSSAGTCHPQGRQGVTARRTAGQEARKEGSFQGHFSSMDGAAFIHQKHNPFYRVFYA